MISQFWIRIHEITKNTSEGSLRRSRESKLACGSFAAEVQLLENRTMLSAIAPAITAPSTASVNQNSSLAFIGADALSVADQSGTAEEMTLSVAHGTLALGTTTGLTVSGNGATLTLVGSLSSLNAGLASLTYTPTAGYHGPDTLKLWNKDTSDGLSVTGSVAITVNPLAPVISAPSTVSVNQNSSLAFTGADALGVVDQSGTAEKMTLSVAHGTLALGTTTGLTVTGNGTAAPTLVGSLSSLDADLATLTYTPTAGYHGSDTLKLWNKDTSDNLSVTDSVAITVNPLPPVISAPSTASVNQNSSLAITGVNVISVADQSGTAEEMTLSVTHGTLTLGATTGLTVTGNGASLTLVGSLSSLNAALATLTYTPTAGYHGSDTLKLWNKDTSDSLSVTGSVAITVNPLPPMISAPSTVSVNQDISLAFTGGEAVSVTDQSGTAEKMTLSVAHGTLALGTTTGLTVTGSGTALLTVVGSLSNLDAALATLTYTPTAGYYGSDTLNLSNEDTSDKLSVTANVAITVNPLPPVISAPSTASVNSGGSVSFAGVSAISVSDPSGTVDMLTLSANRGTMTVATTSGVTIVGSGTKSVTLTGTITDLNTALASLVYTSTPRYYGPDTLVLSSQDTADSLTGTAKVAITVVAVAPTITAPSTASVNQNSSLAFTGVNTLSVADLSSTAEAMTLSVAHGTLALGTTTGLTVSGNGASLTLVGSLSSLDAALATLTYTPTAGYYGSDTLNLSNTDTSDNLSVTGSVAITVKPLPPVISAPSTASVNQNSSLAFTGVNVISVADLNGTAEKMTLSVVHGTLGLGTTTSLTVSGNGTASLTVVGSLSNLDAALATLTYTPTTGYHGSDTLKLSNEDTSDKQSVTASVAITVIPLPPVISAPSTASVNSGGSVSFAGVSAISVNDPSGTVDMLTLSANRGTMTVAPTSGVTIVGSGTKSVTLTGTITDLNTALASLVYTSTPRYYGPDTLLVSSQDTADGLTGTAKVGITVVAVAPTITAPSKVSVNQDSSLGFTGVNMLSVADLSSAAEAMTLSVAHGTLALGTTTGLTVSGNGATLTLVGSLSNLNAALATLTYTPTAGYHGSDTLNLSNTDSSDNLSVTGSVAITVKPLPPVISAPSSVGVSNGGFAFTGANAISVSDPSGTAEKMTLSVAHGTLTLGTTTGLTVSGNGTASVTIIGTLSDLDTALQSLVFGPSTGYSGPDSLSLSIYDSATNVNGVTKFVSISIT